jgi:iron complex outermembrane receptor protein/hemoglobin/transferrin/lactoferrin receptor protein
MPVVGHAGVEWQALSWFQLLLNYDNSFRAPNLDDMTSRQQTGPGFQFENPLLKPERAHTFEIGGRARASWIAADAWVYDTRLEDAIVKVAQRSADCPSNTPQCQASWSRLQLQNAPSYSEIRGAEGGAKLILPWGIGLRGSVSYAWSEGPRVGNIAYGGAEVKLGKRVPLSRTPPFNGTFELLWKHASGFSGGAAMQWSAAQTRLAISDYSDGRIPKYGTPGFAIAHLRAAYRWGDVLTASAVLENIFDSPYRYHGSSVNGAGRGLMVQLEVAPF